MVGFPVIGLVQITSCRSTLIWVNGIKLTRAVCVTRTAGAETACRRREEHGASH